MKASLQIDIERFSSGASRPTTIAGSQLLTVFEAFDNEKDAVASLG